MDDPAVLFSRDDDDDERVLRHATHFTAGSKDINIRMRVFPLPIVRSRDVGECPLLPPDPWAGSQSLVGLRRPTVNEAG